MKLPSKKETLILTAALVLPGGLIALGLWKAYELYKTKPKKTLAPPTASEDAVTVGYLQDNKDNK